MLEIIIVSSVISRGKAEYNNDHLPLPVAELPVDVDDKVPDGGEGVPLDKPPVGTDGGVDLLLDVLLELLADDPVVEEFLVLHGRRKIYFCFIEKSSGKVPGALPCSLSVCKPKARLGDQFYCRNSVPPPRVIADMRY